MSPTANRVRWSADREEGSKPRRCGADDRFEVVGATMKQWMALGLAFAMACAGALGELASVGRVDDNLSIPLAAGLAAHLVVNFFA